MQSNHLSLVPASLVAVNAHRGQAASALVQVATDRRKLFWRAYLTWLATATGEEVDQFERVMAEHAHHVRPLMDAVTEAMRLRETALRLPLTLLAELHYSGWRSVSLPAALPASSPASSPASAPGTHPSSAPREGWSVVA